MGQNQNNSKENIKRIVYLLLATISLIFGLFCIYNGFNKPPKHTPDISEPIVAKANQVKVGPDQVRIKKSSPPLTINSMGREKLLIPAIKVYADIDTRGSIGLVDHYGLILPPPNEVTRWVKGANITSTHGNILLAGHVSYNGVDGALYNLAKVPVGSVAMVSDDSGNRQEFQLESLIPYKKSKLPVELWGSKKAKKLVIVTCGGKMERWADGEWHFDSNIVTTWKPIGKVIQK